MEGHFSFDDEGRSRSSSSVLGLPSAEPEEWVVEPHLPHEKVIQGVHTVALHLVALT